MTGRLHVRNGKYSIILSYKDSAGKSRQKWIHTGLTEKNNKRKAEQLLQDAITDFEQQQEQHVLELASKSMPDLIRDWLKVKKITVRAITYETYRVTAESQVIPYFERLGATVPELTAAHIQTYYTDQMDAGFQPSTMPKHNTIIHGSLQYAVDTLGIISANPADKIKMPKRRKRIPTFYTEEQLKTLFREAVGCPIEVVIRLSATFGLRRSETLGLKWSAVDWKRKTIVIQHTVVRVGSQTVCDDIVKEVASFRTMPLMPDMEVYLQKLNAHQKQMQALCGKDYEVNDYICKWDNGQQFDPNFITRKFRQLLAQKKLPKIRFHDLRHSSASLLINMGFTLKEVQEWLGHADIASTEIYAHLLYKSKESMAEKIGKALFADSGGNTEAQAV